MSTSIDFSKILVPIYKATLRYIPWDSNVDLLTLANRHLKLFLAYQWFSIAMLQHQEYDTVHDFMLCPSSDAQLYIPFHTFDKCTLDKQQNWAHFISYQFFSLKRYACMYHESHSTELYKCHTKTFISNNHYIWLKKSWGHHPLSQLLNMNQN